MRDTCWGRPPPVEARRDQVRLYLRGTRIPCRCFVRVVPPVDVQGLRKRSGGQKLGRNPSTEVSDFPPNIVIEVKVFFLPRRVNGKLPGNLDILFRIFTNQKNGYMLDAFAELYEECKSTTVNLRILWTDKVQ
jgi:hypothetical protein